MEEKIHFRVDGMHCNSCAMNVKLNLEEIDGVKEVDASFDTGKADITYDSEKTSPEVLARAIDELGFTALI